MLPQALPWFGASCTAVHYRLASALSVSVQVHWNLIRSILALGIVDRCPLSTLMLHVDPVLLCKRTSKMRIHLANVELRAISGRATVLSHSQLTAGRCSSTAAKREACRGLAHRKHCPSLSFLKTPCKCTCGCDVHAASGMLCFPGGERADGRCSPAAESSTR